MNKVSIHQTLRHLTLLLFTLFSTQGTGQTSFLQVLTVPSTSLTNKEQTNLTKVQQMPEVVNYWHVETSNFEAALNGRLLQANLPGEAQTTFEADFPYSKHPGTFFWDGYSTDGSYFRLTKLPDEVLGNIHIASSGNYYGLISLSENQTVLVKYDKEIMEIADDCSNVSSGETDDEVEDRFGCEENIVRVLFLFTPAIAGAIPSPTTVAQQIINELNGASMASGISSADALFLEANTLLLPGFVENLDIHDDLDDVCDNSTAQAMRDANYADMVILLTAGHPGSTVGTAGGNSNARAYCVAELLFARTGMTGTHEIGHLLGANHQRCSVCTTTSCDNWTNHHGFFIHDGSPTTPIRRTIMCQNGCAGTRVLRWSNPDSDFMGMETGNWWNNNAMKIRKRAGKIACFRPNPPPNSYPGAQFLVEITGDDEVCNTQQYIPYQSNIPPSPNIAYPLTYLWEVSATGIGNYTQVSTSSSWILFNAATLPGTWTTVRLTVTDANNQVSFDFFEIHRVNCFGGGKGTEDRSSANLDQPMIVLDNNQINASPNPVSESLYLKGLVNGSKVTIHDINGRLFGTFDVQVEEMEVVLLNVSYLSAGVYIATIGQPGQEHPTKIKFVKI